MNNIRSITINTLAQGGAKLFSLGCGFGTTLVLRRWLGRGGFGDYIYIINLVTLLVSVADFGTYLVGVKVASQNPKTQPKVLGNVLDLRLFLSGIFTIIALFLLVIFFQKNSLFYPLLIAVPLIFLLIFKNSVLVFFHSQQKLYLSSLQEALIALLILIAALTLFWTGGSLQLYLALISLGYLIATSPFMVVAWRRIKPKLKPDITLIKYLFIQSLPLGLILSLFTLYSKLDTIILKFFYGSDSVGVYGLAYKIYENLTLPAAFFANSLLPILSQKVTTSKKQDLHLFLSQAADLLLLASGGIIFISWFLAPWVMQLLTGITGKNDETLILRILTFSLPFVFLNHLFGYTIISLGKQIKSLLVSFLALAFNLGANLIFIPRYSFWAAAWITVLTEMLVMFLSYRILWAANHGFPLAKSLPKTVKFLFRMKGEILE
jgi:O-antigen/teichoic acid export membrane protein